MRCGTCPMSWRARWCARSGPRRTCSCAPGAPTSTRYSRTRGRAGAIEARKIDVILDEVTKAGDRHRRAAIGTRCSPTPCTGPGELTVPQLTRHVRAALIVLNPDLAEKRRVGRTRTPRGGPGPGPRCDGPPDRLPARRRGDRGVHRDRRPGRARRRRRGHPDHRPAPRGRVRGRVHRDPGPASHPGRHPVAAQARATRRGAAVRRRHAPCSAWTTCPGTWAPTVRSPPRSPASSPRTAPGDAS